MDEMRTFLLEIGTEEIPARFVVRGLSILRECITGFLNRENIGYGSVLAYATPRRLTICVGDVSGKQKDRTVEALGPPKKAAFDDKGMPTKAASGFARSLNVDIAQLRIVKTDRGEYVCATVEEKGRATVNVISEGLPGLLSSLQLPRTMRWGDGSLRFFRPIRWIIALYGNEIIPFELDGIRSANITYGHRFLSSGKIEINNASEYIPALLRGSVIADHEQRKKMIDSGIKEIEVQKGFKVHQDEDLLDTVTFLVEHPHLVVGSFEGKYLSLPKELLITVMRTHQKYFSTEDSKGQILPYFIVVSNTKHENDDIVRRGAERVLRARLEDARFYFNEDRKLHLQDYVEKLRNVTFQEKLGTLYDKTERIRSLSGIIADRLGLKGKNRLLRAATLSKADLVTGVVREFPELQGYMGLTYALAAGEDQETAEALYEHYLPRFAGDTVPKGETGTIISLADKMDNIASFFYLGLIPSGSEDPFALRRQASGIISILQHKDYPLTLDEIIEQALQNLGISAGDKKVLSEKIRQFFSQRLEGILLSQGYRNDLVSAVLATGELNMKDTRLRLDILTDLRDDPGFPALLTAAKRVYNILSKVGHRDVVETLFKEPVENELFQAVMKARSDAAGGKFRSLFDLERPVHAFFDGVMVMDKDEAIKNNRLALLYLVKNTFETLGDFSRIME